MGNILRNNGGLVIDRPGNVLFIPVNADGTLDYSNAIRNTAKINTITVTNSKTKTEIPDGNSFYAAGDRITAIAGTVAVEFSTVDPAIWAMCSGTEVENNLSDTMMKMYEYMKPVNREIVIEEQLVSDGFVQVIASDGAILEKISQAPEIWGDEYVVTSTSTGTTFTFGPNFNKSVMITAEVVTDTVSYSQGRRAMRYHKIIVDTEFSTLNDSEKIPVNFIVSQASVSGDMVDALQKDPSATKTLTFNMYAPLPGEEPYTVKYADIQSSTSKTLLSIDVTTPPTKVAYTAGETFVKTGMVVTATYTDGTTAAVSGYTYSPTVPLTVNDKVIAISYQGKTASQAITVTAG